MNNEIEFIKNNIKEWCKRFEGIHIKYAYEKESEFHIIEVAPESIRRGNKKYEKAETQLWDDFMASFPDSDLLISEPCRTNNMENIIFDSSISDSSIESISFDSRNKTDYYDYQTQKNDNIQNGIELSESEDFSLAA
jgi:hypothetical protein